jgi:hypothetical protein
MKDMWFSASPGPRKEIEEHVAHNLKAHGTIEQPIIENQTCGLQTHFILTADGPPLKATVPQAIG